MGHPLHWDRIPYNRHISDLAKETESQRFKLLQLPRKLITSVQKIWLFKATLITL